MSKNKRQQKNKENNYVELSSIEPKNNKNEVHNQKQFIKEIKSETYEYNMLDASKNFLYTVLFPLLISFVFIVILTFIASTTKLTTDKINGNIIVKYISLLLAELTFVGILFVYHKKKHINIISSCNLKKKLDYKKIIIVVLLSAVTVFLVAPFINLVDHLFGLFNYKPSADLPFVMNNFFKFILGVIAMAVIPAIVEELLFRGVIQKGLQKNFKPVFAILISAVMFMLMHGSLQQTVYQFILGVILGTIAYLGGSIVYAMIFHFVNNFTVVLLSYIQTVNNTNSTASFTTAMDYILPIILLIVACALIVGLFYMFKNTSKIFAFKSAKQNNAVSETISSSTEIVPLKKNVSLTYQEKIYFYTSIGIAVLMWIINTASAFFV